MSPEERRFWDKVDVTEGCWNWQSSTTSEGYGRFSVGGRDVSAARWFYELNYGPIAEGMLLRRTCENRRCVRLDHLEPCSRVDHAGISKGPISENARKTECIRGHALKGDNLYVDPNGSRKCIQCRTGIYERRKARFKGKRRPKPAASTLKRKMRSMNFTALGEYYGVSDTAVRKWAKAYGLR